MKSIKEILEAKGMSQRELARQIGTSNATISRIIKGDWNVTARVLIAIADHFCVSLDWLVGRE